MGYDLVLMNREHEILDKGVSYNWNIYGFQNYFYIRELNNLNSSEQVQKLTIACELLESEIDDITTEPIVDYYGKLIEPTKTIDDKTLLNERMKRYYNILNGLLNDLTIHPDSHWVTD